MNYYAHYHSPIGPITLVSDGQYITGLYTKNHKLPNLGEKTDEPALFLFKEVAAWLNDYFNGCNPDPSSIPVLPHGTAFQKEVWNRLCRIPYGSSVTYGQIAEEIAAIRQIPRMSAQAVGQAVGANPISIIIPCHRVLGTNGALTGYAGGLETKIWLLNHEKCYY